MQIRSTENGRVVHTFRAPRRITWKTVWESNRRVLLTARGHKVTALVRCTIGGKCNRASRFVKRPRNLKIEFPWEA